MPNPDDPRPAPAAGRDLAVRVRTRDGTLHPGVIALVGSEVVTLSLAADRTPAIESPTDVTLLFVGGQDGELAVHGHLVPQPLEPYAARREYHFRTAGGAEESSGERSSETHSSFKGNRREAVRVDVEHHGIGVVLRPHCNPNLSLLRQLVDLRLNGIRRTVKGIVLDLSADGVAVRGEKRDEPPFANGDHIDLALDLPGHGSALQMGAVMQRCDSEGRGTVYGLLFDPSATTDFPLTQQKVLEFVMREQREHLSPRDDRCA